ncbi:MAG TPA: glycosyltransferase family 9 protein [Clostridiales bacterium]|nr:glycosyltransferase family 9 protein [Clostridiales bacterium]
MKNKIGNKLTPQQISQIKRILIIQYKPFGDVLLNTAYFPSLRKKFPDAVIDYLVQRPYKTILEDNPYLDNLIIMEKKKGKTLKYYLERLRTIIRVRKLKYDAVLDSMRGPGSSQITFFSGAKFKIGWKKRLGAKYNWAYDYLIIRDHKIYAGKAKYGLLKPFGLEETSDNIFYHVKPESIDCIDSYLKEQGLTGKKIITFSPVTPIARKQWKLERFAKTADLIKDNFGFDIILLWGPGEKEKVEYMASMMKNKPFIAPDTTFNQAAALLKRTYIYIGNDGGINHLAVSQDTPTIAVFGPKTDPLKWTAWHIPIHKYLRDFDFKDPGDNSFNISPEDVLGKFRELNDYLNDNGKCK